MRMVLTQKTNMGIQARVRYIGYCSCGIYCNTVRGRNQSYYRYHGIGGYTIFS
jgi:hypothetical protein